MPSHRRRPTPPPARRPQVAGLRRPGSKPSPRPRPTPYSAQHEDLHTDEQFADGTQAPVEPFDVAPAVDEPAAEAVETAEPETLEADDAEAVKTAEPEAAPGPRPTPRRKARDTGVIRPTTEDEIELAPPIEEAAELPSGPSRPRDEVPFRIGMALAALFTVAALVFAVLFIVAKFSSSDATANRAHTDASATQQAEKEINGAVQTLFSYDYSKLVDRDKQVNDLLGSDKLRDQFTTLNCAVKEEAPKQQIATLTKVSFSAITQLQDDTAEALVFVENAWERKSTKQQGSGAGSLGITAKRVDGTWKLTEIDILGGETGQKPKVPAKCK